MKKRPENIIVSSTGIKLVFSNGSATTTSIDLFPRLVNATEEQRTSWRWIGPREGIHWPDVDEDISVRTLVRESQQTKESFLKVPELIADLYRITQHFERLFHDRHFTLDGHLVGSIGEVVARYVYDLVLEECSTPRVDARTRDGRTVQIKLTGPNGKGYGVRWSNVKRVAPPDLLICLKLTPKGFGEIYAGRFPEELLLQKADTSNGQISLPLTKLQSLQVHELPQQKPLAEFNRMFKRELAQAA